MTDDHRLAAWFAQVSTELLSETTEGLTFEAVVRRAVEVVPGCDGASVTLPPGFAAVDQALLSDPQTSGGLLVSCAPESVAQVLAIFRRHGFEAAAEIGEITGEAPGRLVVRQGPTAQG